jgi:hypothetical protein
MSACCSDCCHSRVIAAEEEDDDGTPERWLTSYCWAALLLKLEMLSTLALGQENDSARNAYKAS